MGRDIQKRMAMEQQTYLRRKEASAYLRNKYGLTREPSTLAKLAVVGGPPFRLLNRIPRYTPADLDEWVASRLGPLVCSTSSRAELMAKQAAVTSPDGKSASSEPEAYSI
jgi:hypothetical protein